MIATTAPFARIALAIPVRELFDYRVPEALAERVLPGMRVRVPFGHGKRIGYCIERAAECRHPEPKDIDGVLDDEPLLDPGLLKLVRWTADYYLASVGEVIEAAIPRRVREGRLRLVKWVQRAEADPAAPANVAPDATPKRKTAKSAATQERILELLEKHGPLPLEELIELAGCSASPVETLARHGAVSIFKARPPALGSTGAAAAAAAGDEAQRAPPALTADQIRAIAAIRAAATGATPRFEPFLLFGVTGSGKTEVYLRAIAEVLAAGRTALVLVPEISLTPQTVARFRARFGEVAVLHSLLPPDERSVAYGRLRRGELRVAIGARSAIFAPLPALGLIVVDECHESSYKQESSPRYHGTDLAVVRASQLGIPCVLGSATPTLEQLENARSGRFTLLELPHRVTANTLACMEIVDRRLEKKSEEDRVLLFSPRLLDLLRETLARREQSILLLNRRGFARNIHCPTCGFSQRCDSCDITLTYHKGRGQAQCHYCGQTRPVPVACPQCGFAHMRRSLAGTERIEETLEGLLPEARIGRLDRDTATSRDRVESILGAFRRGELDILVGTQMVAKGHDIPAVTLVGVIDADVALGFPDFRAAERTAQLLCQVAGRAGRGDRPGRVVVQTRQPEHYAIEAARRQDLRHLFTKEADVRRLLGYPPYGYLVRVLCEDEDEKRAAESAAALRAALGAGGAARGAVGNGARPALQVLGPAPAPLARLRNRHRYQLLLKGRDRRTVHDAAERLSKEKPRWSTTRVVIDVDPQNLL